MLSRRKSAPRPRVYVLAAVAALVLPVSFSGSEGAWGNELCASGNCCFEVNSTCTANGKTMYDYYTSISGQCKIINNSTSPSSTDI